MTRRSGRRVGALMVLMLTACQPPSSSAPSVTAPTPVLSPTASDAAEPPISPGATATVAGVVVDGALLAHVPASVAGTPLEPDLVTAGEVAADPSLGKSASAIAMGIYVAPGTSSEDDLAIVSVVQLRPGVFDEAFFADWRSAYDAAACDAAGGVGASSAREIAGREVFVGSCAQDADLYHAHLDGDVLVSVTSVGPMGLGERVAAGLRP